MGFKCRVLQLQGELEAQRKELRDNSSGVLARDEVERLERENVKLKSELAKARRDVQEAQQEKDQLQREFSKARQLAEGYKGECQSLVQDYQTAGGQIRTMEGQIRSLEEERDWYKRQADMHQRELALQGDRVKALEEQLQHVNLQVGWREVGQMRLTYYGLWCVCDAGASPYLLSNRESLIIGGATPINEPPAPQGQDWVEVPREQQWVGPEAATDSHWARWTVADIFAAYIPPTRQWTAESYFMYIIRDRNNKVAVTRVAVHAWTVMHLHLLLQ